MRKILSMLSVPVLILALTTNCSDDEGITYSMTDASSKVTGFSKEKIGAGAELTISGSGLDKVKRIFMGNVAIPARSFASQTESSITLNVPPTVALGENNVLIVFAGSERAFKKIEVIPLQAIGSFTPSTAAEGDVVTLLGVNFDLVTGVKLGDLDAPIVSQTETSIRFTTPSGYTNTGKITLVGSAGNANSASDLVACSGTVVGCETPLNLNSDLELGDGDNFTNWNKSNGGQYMVATTVPGETYRGSRAIKVIRDGTLNPGQWRIQLASDLIPTEIGASYKVHIWAKASVAGGAFRVSLNPDTGYYGADVNVTTSWQRFTFEVPGERIQNAETRFVLDLNGNNTAATTFYIDDIRIVKN